MTENTRDDLASAIESVEGMPLEQRAEGYGQIYENVRAQLERGDSPEGNAQV